MKANQFIKKFGWEKAREYLLNIYFEDRVKVDLQDLKRYVDAYELVQSLDGLMSARITLQRGEFEDYEI